MPVALIINVSKTREKNNLEYSIHTSLSTAIFDDTAWIAILSIVDQMFLFLHIRSEHCTMSR